MMKIEVSEAEREVLNWMVAKCEGYETEISNGGWVVFDTYQDNPPPTNDYNDSRYQRYSPSTDWSQGGPIIERERISLEYLPGAGDGGLDVWVATRIEHPAFSEEQGNTPLIAAMRAYVVSKLGSEVDVPDELTNNNIP